MRLLLSPAAEADLIDIALYIASDDPERAMSFVDELEAACAVLVDHLHAGVARPEIGDGIRSKPYGDTSFIIGCSTISFVSRDFCMEPAIPACSTPEAHRPTTAASPQSASGDR